jgi:hypothetical protein
MRAPTAERCVRAPACKSGEQHMPRHFQPCEGPIEGLHVPQLAWDVFHRENIQTIDQLRAVADQLEQFEGIGPITARVIRQELNRVAAPGEQLFDDGQLSAWGA